MDSVTDWATAMVDRARDEGVSVIELAAAVAVAIVRRERECWWTRL
jgi:lysylphosphatidylglycerol synthetase-like protein (DUF2156 family)